jgi:hypothetical protein
MPRRNRDQLRQEYLGWLEAQFRDEHGNPDKSYWDLLNLMFEKDFRWSHPMDENRAVDGLDLRVYFAREQGLLPSSMDFLGPQCSFLELLIGLSKRLAFLAEGNASGWAWNLLGNLELHRMWDPLTPAKRRRAEEIMDNVIERRYLPDGTGGFFPLAWPDDDMTQIELWYQMNAYVSELHPEH